MSRINEIKDKVILISPLNWGMGHVSRCIALIEKLRLNNTIIVACNEDQKKIFTQYHPNLQYEDVESYPFKFSKKKSFLWSILTSFRGLIKHSYIDQKRCQQLCDKWEVDLVISDHRYGFYSKRNHNIFLTHQVKLPLAWHLWLAQKYHEKLLRNFQELWIVDDHIINLAGILSTPIENIPYQFIGFLSRFDNNISLNKSNENYLLLSGPAEFWGVLINRFDNEDITAIIGPSEAKDFVSKTRIPFYESSNWLLVDEKLQACNKIFGYIGYTTLMDLQFLKCSYELIPCPGQLEQEYLKKHICQK